jgi:hypothetical protein
MEKQALVDKAVETLRPFETQNLMATIQNLTLQQIFSNWAFLLVTLAILFLGIYKKSKTVLLTLFFLVALIVMVKFAMPAPDQEMGLKTILPFVGFGLGIGGVIVYFTFVKD